MATKHEVYRLHLEHPEWTSRQIANVLGCSPSYVRATASRGGYSLGEYCSPKEKVLKQAARALLAKHIELVASGDCGFWDAEQEPEVIAMRKALGDCRD